MNEHQRLQAIKHIRYAVSIIKENAVESGDYRARHQRAILEAISGMKAQIDALFEEASLAIPEKREPGAHPEVISGDGDKLAYIREGDYLRVRGLDEEEILGPVSLHPGESKTIILVPGKLTEQVAVLQHRILAVISNGIETIRFEQERKGDE